VTTIAQLPARPKRGVPAWLLLALVAVALTLNYSVALVGGMGGVTLPRALLWSFETIAVALVLGGLVWKLTGAVPWPARPRIGFLAVQVAAAALYTFAFVTIDVLISAVMRGRTDFFEFWRGSITGIDWVFGTFMYGLIVGLCYSIRMQQRNQLQQEALVAAEGLAARAQVGALRAQLNPHFLFNALHSLAPLVRHDPDAAEAALDRLGDLLRYALDDKMCGDVTLDDEWSFVRNYLALEQLRLGDRLRVEADLDEDALDQLVPSFLLQPLVENAVRHGIAPLARGGTIAVTARVEGQRLLISVSDDGAGALDHDIRNAGGLGLRALRERLAVRYAGAARLDVHTSPGAGLRVGLALPLLDETDTIVTSAPARPARLLQATR
jgi:hypothetical protein